MTTIAATQAILYILCAVLFVVFNILSLRSPAIATLLTRLAVVVLWIGVLAGGVVAILVFIGMLSGGSLP